MGYWTNNLIIYTLQNKKQNMFNISVYSQKPNTYLSYFYPRLTYKNYSAWTDINFNCYLLAIQSQKILYYL